MAQESASQQHIQVDMIQCIEDPSMNWSVGDSLYACCKTWKLKCKNILEEEMQDMFALVWRSKLADVPHLESEEVTGNTLWQH